jgi:hypothetical protein
MNCFRRIFSGLHPSYIIRSYLIGLVFFGMIAAVAASSKEQAGLPLGMIAISVLNTLLFPFSKLVWDELRNLALGNNVIIMNAIFLFMLKWLINTLLWGFAIVVAPAGILYLWYRTREPQPE